MNVCGNTAYRGGGVIISGVTKGLAPLIENFCSTSEKLHQLWVLRNLLVELFLKQLCSVYLCVPLRGWVDDVFPCSVVGCVVSLSYQVVHNL